jgi:hypothetical protein
MRKIISSIVLLAAISETERCGSKSFSLIFLLAAISEILVLKEKSASGVRLSD